MNESKRKLNYTWVIVVISFLMVLVSLGFCSSVRNLYLGPITDALNIDRGLFSLNDTVRFIATTILNLFFGTLIKRFGMKKLVCAGFVSLIIFAVINSFATTYWHFYVGAVFLGIGLSWTSTTMVSSIINKWCKNNKSTITGAVLAANGIGGAIASMILSPIIMDQSNPMGYQTSYRLVAVILAVTTALVFIFFKDPPKEEGESTAPTKKKARGTGWVGMDYELAVRKPYFYVTLICIFLSGMVLQGLNGNAVTYMQDLKLDASYVALLVSASSLALTGTKFLAGFLYDRLGIRVTISTSLICAFVSVMMLFFVSNTPVGKVFAFIRIILCSAAMPLETVMIPIFATEFFGNKAFDKIIGPFVAASSAGFALGSPFGNFCYSLFGSYKVAFIIFAVSAVIIFVSLQYVIRSAGKDRREIEEHPVSLQE